MNTQRQGSLKSWHRASPTIVYAAVPALLLGVFLAWGVRHDFRGNWSALFYFGDAWVKGGALPRNAFVRKGGGYDGQFYYRVGRDPFLPLARLGLGASSDPVLGIDTLAYRYRRIAYPLAARLVALGTTDGLVWSFPLVSVLGLWLGVFSTSRLFETFRWQRWWGVLYAMLPGLVFSASRNLGEGLAISLVSTALLAIAQRRTSPAIGLLTIAHLAHETTVLVSIGCFMHALYRSGRPRQAAPYLLPVAVALLWSATVAAAFLPGLGALLSPPGSENLGVPLEGMWHKLGWLVDPKHAAPAYAYLPRIGRFRAQEALLVTPILLALAVLLKAAWTRDTETWLTGLLVSLFVLTFGDRIWQDAASYARVTSLALLLALRSVAEAPDLAGYAFLASLPLGAVAALGSCADNWRAWLLT
jgi:hypothetical protein